MAVKGNARRLFRLSSTVSGRRVEIVHTMLDGIIHFAVHHLLVDVGIRVVAQVETAFYGQSHHAISQERHLVARVGIDAHSHLILGRLLRGEPFKLLFVPTFASGKEGRRSNGSRTTELQELSS